MGVKKQYRMIQYNKQEVQYETHNTMQYETQTQYNAIQNVDEPQYDCGGFASPPAQVQLLHLLFGFSAQCSMLREVVRK